MRELEPAAVADVIERVCATETFADVTPVWDKKPDTEVRSAIDYYRVFESFEDKAAQE